MNVGDRVRINAPENPRLHGTLASVASLEPWGAHLFAPAAATGRFRAVFEEMVPVLASSTGDVCDECGSVNMTRNGTCLLCLDCGRTTGC